MADSQPGPRPAWNGWGLALAAVAVTLFVVLFVPPAPTDVPEATVPTSAPPGHTITLDELQAMLTTVPGEPPPTVQVETPDGPVTVVVPETTQPPTTTTSTTTTSAPTTTTTTTVPHRPTPVDDMAGDILDDLVGRTTIPEGAGGVP